MAYAFHTDSDLEDTLDSEDSDAEVGEDIGGIKDPEKVHVRQLDLGIYNKRIEHLWAVSSASESGADIPSPHGYESDDYVLYMTEYEEKYKQRIEAIKEKLTTSAKIYIPYRDEGRGKAAFYDHYTVQRATGMETVVVAHLGQDIESFMDFVKASPLGLPLGRKMKIVDKKMFPEVIDTLQFWWWGAGLLFIPGCAVDAAAKRPEAYELRDNLTTLLIAQSQRKGLPILAVCGGAYKLYQHYGMQEDKLVFGHLRDVRGHAARKMPSVSEETGFVRDNVQVHDIDIVPGTILSGIVGVQRLMVNSVHSKAPDEKSCPPTLEITARSTGACHAYLPEVGTIEAFEAKYGAPVVGTVFHPEAYAILDRKRNAATFAPQDVAAKHCTILKDMAAVGEVARKRRRVMAELVEDR